MTEQNAVEADSRRLALALEALAAAVERRREAAKGETNLTAQLHALGTDRAGLASELDAATARALKTLADACNANASILNSLLFSYMDYSAVGYR